ncbi:cache domain-containing protein [uncultured Brachyspira sp.]|uniref:cache domain-containing protein n=1 Tax=uncultured Brachyspira sp. TaxID=221953 RepID=UPI002638F073|nr:cache domain-containing protein [uncultured Brachyspira sp.]
MLKSKFNSLALKIPAILCIVTAVFLTMMLIISLRISGRGISKSRFEGFETTVTGYSSVFNAWFRIQSYLIETYSSVAIVVENVLNPNDNTAEILNATLRGFREKNAGAIHMGIVDINGIIISDGSYPNWIGERFSNKNTDVWNKLKNKEYGYGSVVYDNKLEASESNEELSFTFATPIKYQNREIGYLYVVFNWRAFFKNYIEGIKLGTTGGLDVIAPNMKLFVNTDYDKINSDAPSVYKDVFNNNYSKGVVAYNVNGVEMMGSYVKMHYVPWIISMTMTSDEIYAENKKAVVSGVILGIITIICLAVFICL